MADEINEVQQEVAPTQNDGGPVPGSSAIIIEDAPPFVPPPAEKGEVSIFQEPEPAKPEPPAPAPVAPIDARTLAEQAVGRAKVEEHASRERLRASAREDNSETPGGEDARIAASKADNSEL